LELASFSDELFLLTITPGSVELLILRGTDDFLRSNLRLDFDATRITSLLLIELCSPASLFALLLLDDCELAEI
jgi:hypothetical protein